MTTLNNAYAPNTDEIIDVLRTIRGTDNRLTYLAEIASYDYQCPDKCDQWAMEFLENYEDEINDSYDYLVKVDLDLEFVRGK